MVEGKQMLLIRPCVPRSPLRYSIGSGRGGFLALHHNQG